MRPQLILSALLIGCSSLVAAYSKGAPFCIADAAKMTEPKTMGKEAKIGYTVSAKEIAKGYTPGGKAIKVTVGGVKTFKGILLYAVNAAKDHVGTFELPKGLQYKADCQGDNGKGTLTHTDATDKPTTMDIFWTPPAKAGTGSITFVGTFVAGKAIGFEMAKSIEYPEIGGTPKGTDTAAPPASTNTPTQSPPVGSTPTTAATPTASGSGGMSISQYSSFGALALVNIAAAFILI